MTIVNLDGTRILLKARDLDGDGVTGGVEALTPNVYHDTQMIEGKVEGAELIKELNKDDFENVGFSSIEKLTRLHIIQVPAFTTWDVSLGNCIPLKWQVLTRKMSRYSVSLDGLGRQESVNLIGRKTEAERSNTSKIGDYLKKLTGANKEDGNNNSK